MLRKAQGLLGDLIRVDDDIQSEIFQVIFFIDCFFIYD